MYLGDSSQRFLSAGRPRHRADARQHHRGGGARGVCRRAGRAPIRRPDHLGRRRRAQHAHAQGRDHPASDAQARRPLHAHLEPAAIAAPIARAQGGADGGRAAAADRGARRGDRARGRDGPARLWHRRYEHDRRGRPEWAAGSQSARQRRTADSAICRSTHSAIHDGRLAS